MSDIMLHLGQWLPEMGILWWGNITLCEFILSFSVRFGRRGESDDVFDTWGNFDGKLSLVGPPLTMKPNLAIVSGQSYNLS